MLVLYIYVCVYIYMHFYAIQLSLLALYNKTSICVWLNTDREIYVCVSQIDHSHY